VKKVVFMGMGEPAHNLDAVLDAIHLLGTGGNIGHKNLVFSAPWATHGCLNACRSSV
jgi:23S rRNA (adenine2503-C2)-methyltransferase